MDRELKKTLDVMYQFTKNNSFTNKKIFVYKNLMYATDDRIMLVTENKTKNPFLSYFTREKNTGDFEYCTKETSQYSRETIEALEKNFFLAKLIQRWNFSDLSFDIDLTDFDYKKLKVAFKNRYRNNNVYLNFENNEVIFDLEGGWSVDGGLSVTFGEGIKEVNTSADVMQIAFRAWYLIELLKLNKGKVHFEVFTERKHVKCKAGEYTVFFTLNTNSERMRK